MWVATTNFPTTASRPFYTRLNQRLAEHYFDDFVERLCQPFYAEILGRPGLPSGCTSGCFQGFSGCALNPNGSINKSARNQPIAVDPSVAQKRPIPPRVFQHSQINFTNQNFFFIVRGLRDHASKWI